MASTSADAEAVAVTDERHDNSWSANLEKPEHADDVELVLVGADQAIEHTVPGNHVNLVTHGEHGHPSEYLYEHLESAFGETVEYDYVEQCGCGGHVTRVQVLSE
jgi:putative CGCGG family rSAM target protein